MIFLKACPKCRGPLNLDRDMYGAYLACLQCGFMKDVGLTNDAAGDQVPLAGKQASNEEMEVA